MKRILISITSIVLVAMLAIVGFVGAQDDEETPAQPFLGINFDEAENGVLVTFVTEGTPAEDASLAEGDVITAVDGVEVTIENFVDVILGYTPDAEITLTVDRDGESVELSVVLGERVESSNVVPFTIPEFNFSSGVFLGIEVNNSDAGVEIVAVMPESPAEEAGLQAGDMLTAVNGEVVTDVRQAIETIAMNAVGDEITLTVMRDGEEIEITATLDEMQGIGRITMFSSDEIIYLEDEDVWEVVELDEDSPLAEIGLETGDRIVSINGESPSPRELVGMLRDLIEMGDLTLTIERDDETIQLDVPVMVLLPLIGGRGFGEFGDFDGMMPPIIIEPRNGNEPRRGNDSRNDNRVRLGVTYMTLDEQAAVEYEASVTEGAYITDVDENSPADQAGLQAGDVILSVDGDVLDFERTLSDRLSAYEPSDVVTLAVLRDGETIEIEAILGGRERRANVMPFFGDDMFNFENGHSFDFFPEQGRPSLNPANSNAGSDL